jgi:prevent-host-death family protein
LKTVGIKELKTRATQIVREVREECSEYVVTVDGKPVARLVPFTAEDEERRYERDTRAKLDRIDRLAAEIGAAWTSPLTAAEAVAAQRR